MQIDFAKIQSDIEEIKSDLSRLISRENHVSNNEKDRELLTVDECAEFLHLSKSTIYTKISQGDIPVKKNGKRCYFLKSELIEWIQGRQS